MICLGKYHIYHTQIKYLKTTHEYYKTIHLRKYNFILPIANTIHYR